MKEAKRQQVTEQICKQAQLMRRGGAKQTEIAKLLGVNPCTISRLEAAGFDIQTYNEQQRKRREMEKKAKEEPVVTVTVRHEELLDPDAKVPGQIEMDLKTVEKPADMSEQVKMMRFLAGQMDRLYMKLETLNDTMCQILRAMRKE